MAYTSQYPPEHSATYVLATYIASYYSWDATNPSTPLTGTWDQANMWYHSGDNAWFHIDLGSGKIIRRIYYEPNHYSGSNTQYSCKDFTFYGSNSSSDFDDITYANMGTWTQLTIDASVFQQHDTGDNPDPNYILVTNTTSYRYYGFKISTSYAGGGANMGMRRIELQTEDGYNESPSPNVSDTSTLTDSITTLEPYSAVVLYEVTTLTDAITPEIFLPGQPTLNGLLVTHIAGVPVNAQQAGYVSIIDGVPVEAPPKDGKFYVCTFNDKLYWYSNGDWHHT